MEAYSPDELAKLAGVSVRTLHYYDSIGLLPAQRRENGYRAYTSAEVERLQRIMQLRATGMRLADIRSTVDSGRKASAEVLKLQRIRIASQIERLNAILENIDASLTEAEGGAIMADKDRFEAFKHDMVAKNEKDYGAEARERYGDEAVEASNAKLMGMTEDRYKEVQKMESEMFEALHEAMAEGSTTCDAAKRAFELHREWLCSFWKEGSYSPAAHAGLAQMYVSDERFRKHYEDQAGIGAVEFLRDIIVANTTA